MAEPDIGGAFAAPFAEQIAFFRAKLGNLVPTARWDDMTGAAHDTGFMVAGAAKADLLADLAAAVDKAIAEGRGIEEFRTDFRSIVARHGWTGWAGEGSVKGEAWRVKTILRTNAYTSYSAGRFAQLSDEDWPFWVYFHGGSLEPRLQHLNLNGLALPRAHRFWAKFYPPSDWGCSCYVIGARSAAGVKRLGGDPTKKLPAGWDKINPKTGEPHGIGKGWGYAPGASVVQTVSMVAGKVGSWDYQIAKAFMETLPIASADAMGDAYRALPSTADDARRYAQRVYEPKPDLPDPPPQRTLGLVRSDQARQISAFVERDISGYDFSIDPSAVRHVRGEHGNDAIERSRGQRGVGPTDFAKLPLILAKPDRIVHSGTSTMAEAVIDFVKEIEGEIYTASMVVRGAKRRTLALKTLFIRKAGKRRAPAPTS